jgi:hypothetical protein
VIRMSVPKETIKKRREEIRRKAEEKRQSFE